jgi:hypothetical protein
MENNVDSMANEHSPSLTRDEQALFQTKTASTPLQAASSIIHNNFNKIYED